MSPSQPTLTTFRVSSKEPQVYQSANVDFIKSLEHRLKHYKGSNCTELLQSTKFSETCRLSIRENGFVDTVIDCYNGHHNIVLRPDDIWTAIMTQFSFFVNRNSEKFRNKFVNFEGKRELVVSADGSLRSMSYAYLVKEMSKKIDENLVDPEVKSWILPSFSTTTDNDLVTCGVIFMATMKKYFNFTFSLRCGIPYVTLDGTVDDWENILKRLEKLKEYECQELLDWYDILRPILKEFVKAKTGAPNVRFWDRICSYHGRGSGHRWISGWITAFCVFDNVGNWQGPKQKIIFGLKVGSEWPLIDINDIPSGTVEVEVKIDDNGTIHHSSLFAGHLAIDLLDNGKTLKPIVGWVIGLKPKATGN